MPRGEATTLTLARLTQSRLASGVQGVLQSFLALRDDAAWKCTSNHWQKNVTVSRNKFMDEQTKRYETIEDESVRREHMLYLLTVLLSDEFHA